AGARPGARDPRCHGRRRDPPRPLDAGGDGALCPPRRATHGALAVSAPGVLADRAPVDRSGETARTFWTAVRLGWQMEANWTDPLLFFLYSVGKPVAAGRAPG